MVEKQNKSNDNQPGIRRLSVLVWLLLVIVSLFLIRDYTHLWGTATPRTVTPRGDLAGSEKSRIELFRNASPSVVYITTLEVRRDVFSLNLYQIPKGTGSGIVWDDGGHIVTNFHVILNADADCPAADTSIATLGSATATDNCTAEGLITIGSSDVNASPSRSSAI